MKPTFIGTFKISCIKCYNQLLLEVLVQVESYYLLFCMGIIRSS